MDRFSAARANLQAGNSATAPCIEWDLGRMSVRCSQAVTLVIGGAPCKVTCDGQTVERYKPVALAPGAVLQTGPLKGGNYGYVACRGGLRRGEDGFVIINAQNNSGDPKSDTSWQTHSRWAARPGVIRCLPGPDWHASLNEVLSGPWRVDSTHRMGFRLQGPRLPDIGYDIRSAPVCDGCVQLSPAGPLVLMRDRGSLGGYRRGWVVIDSDLDLLAQYPRGASVRFQMVSPKEAASINAVKTALL